MIVADTAFEVDFIFQQGRFVLAIEVKTGAIRDAQPGLDAFRARRRSAVPLPVGKGGLALETFLTRSPEAWVNV